ncbi:MAG: 2-phosphosulfolactate phosphatase [Bacteroidales bacterium]|nr:2-phosphosulfolactate phosphatase [Bacteroidales bacterium]
MIIDIIPYASAIRPDLIKERTVVVIDVLRASSVMITALAHGAKAFVPAASVKAALQIASGIPSGECLLGGERDTKIIEGFNLGNSPLDYTEEAVKDKTVVLATSNGTKALNALHDAKRIFIGAFLNMKALTEKLADLDELVLVCSGTNNNFSMDDALCASTIIDRISEKKEVKLSDLALTIQMAFHDKNLKHREQLHDCYHMNLLIRNGFEKDVDYCLQEDLFNIVPEMQEGKIVVPDPVKAHQKTKY